LREEGIEKKDIAAEVGVSILNKDAPLRIPPAP